jgi:probable F420-dependent oxidoreductase
MQAMGAVSARKRVGKVGIWSMELRFGDKAEGTEAAQELEELGYGALWIPGGIDDAVLGDVDRLLAATRHMAIATGIINVWKQPAADVAAWFKAQSPEHQNRVMLGLGVSHGPLIGETWGKPLATMRAYLDTLDVAGVNTEAFCLAALGPKMLDLAARRTGGAHPYLVTPEHTALAREIMDEDALLAPEQGVVLETDPAKARGLAREAVDHYRNLPNYRSNWLRLGISEASIEAMDDSFIDALFAWGTPETIAQRVKAHHDAGADHVCLQVIRGAMGGPIDGLRAACRELAGALL